MNSSPAIHFSPATLNNQAKQPDSKSETSPVPTDSSKVTSTVTSQDSQGSRGTGDGAHQDRQQQDSQQQAAYSKPQVKAKPAAPKNPQTLSDQERKQVEQLRVRDMEVRAHEAAHLAAAGQYATSGAKYEFARGPDGRSYAVGGSVGIDTSAEATPEATIRKAEQVKRAALAPADPSGQDRSVAAQASAMKLKAQAELAKEPTETEKDNAKDKSATDENIIAADEAKASQQGNVAEAKSVAEVLGCGVCGGGHSTEPHLASNVNKLNSYSGYGGDRGSQRLISASA